MNYNTMKKTVAFIREWMPYDRNVNISLSDALKRGSYNGYYYCHGENIAAVGSLKMICEGRYDECVEE